MTSSLFLLRHGETEWTISGRHTGTSEIPLTPRGEDEARDAGARLARFLARHAGGTAPTLIASPRIRARRTCELALPGVKTEISDDLREWTYGDYEGLVQSEIQARFPGWDIFEHGCPGGESPAQVAARADRFIEKARALPGPVVAVSHGHFTRVLALRWIGLPLVHGNRFDSDTASIAHLSASKDSGKPLIRVWNAT